MKGRGGWVPIDKDLLNDPAVMELALALRDVLNLRVHRQTSPVGAVDLSANDEATFLRNVAIGSLVTLWCYADEHLREGDTLALGSDALDAVIGVAGFTDLLPEKWLRELEGGAGVQLPGYAHKNGLVHKDIRKANGRDRTRRYRERLQFRDTGVTHGVQDTASQVTPANVTEASHPVSHGDACNGDVDVDVDKREEALHSGSSPPPDSDSSLRTTAVGGAKFRARPTRMAPKDWVPTEELLSAMRTECPQVDLERELRAFKDHTFGTARSDWPATYRNWIRKSASTMRGKPTRFEEMMRRMGPEEE